MYYLVHLAVPAIVALVIATTGRHVEWSMFWFEHTVESFTYSYMIFALPHWVWAAISGYFDAPKATTIGGFVGAHLLLFPVLLIVSLSNAPESANGWFLYFLASPFAVTIGAFAGRRVASWKQHQSA